MEKEVRVESSVPVQARVSIVDLAHLVMFWEGQGFEIRTMSQLVAWSIGLMAERVVENGLVSREVGVSEANQILAEKKLYQKSMRKRVYKKVAVAMGFEELRKMGVEPRSEAPGVYKIVHEHRRAAQLEEIPQEELERIARLEIQKKRYEEEQKRKAIEEGKKAGLVVEEE